MEDKTITFIEINSLLECLNSNNEDIEIDRSTNIVGSFTNKKRREYYYHQSYDIIYQKISKFADNLLYNKHKYI